LSRHARKPLDVHLMISHPDQYLEAFAQAGAWQISVHYEACIHLHRTLQQIKALGCKAGIALNPHTPVSVLEDILHEADLVCLMSVNPGFGGQAFIEHTYHKIVALRRMIEERQVNTLIEIDGGVNLVNAYKLLGMGADVLVAGNFVFKSDNPIKTIAELSNIGVLEG
jgi:ribulose-phosphate 3-epimerase